MAVFALSDNEQTRQMWNHKLAYTFVLNILKKIVHRNTHIISHIYLFLFALQLQKLNVLCLSDLK